MEGYSAATSWLLYCTPQFTAHSFPVYLRRLMQEADENQFAIQGADRVLLAGFEHE